MPAVSVLMPFRDAAATLGEAIASIRAQTFADLELLLIDDGSADDSATIAAAAASEDPRLRLLRPGRVGLIAAHNLGLAECRAPLVARLDADDVALPHRLARQLALLDADRSLTAVGCLVECFALQLRAGFSRYQTWINRLVDHAAIVRELYVDSPLVHPSLVFRRAAVLALGGYQERGWPEDYDLVLRLAEVGARFAKVPEVLLRWRDSAGRLTRTHPRYRDEAVRRCKAHYLGRGPLRGGRVVLWGAGPFGRRLARALAAEGVTTAAFVDIDPRKLGRRTRGAPVVPSDWLASHRELPVVAVVGARGARPLIRARLEALGFVEGESFWFAA